MQTTPGWPYTRSQAKSLVRLYAAFLGSLPGWELLARRLDGEMAMIDDATGETHTVYMRQHRGPDGAWSVYHRGPDHTQLVKYPDDPDKGFTF